MQVLDYLCVEYKQKQLTPLTVISVPKCSIRTKGRTLCLFPQHSLNCPDSHLRKSTKRFLIIKTSQRTVQIYYNFPLIILFIYKIYIYKPFIYHWYKSYKALYINQYSCVIFILTKKISKLYWPLFSQYRLLFIQSINRKVALD